MSDQPRQPDGTANSSTIVQPVTTSTHSLREEETCAVFNQRYVLGYPGELPFTCEGCIDLQKRFTRSVDSSAQLIRTFVRPATPDYTQVNADEENEDEHPQSPLSSDGFPPAREAFPIVDEPAAPAGFPAADEVAKLFAQPSRRPVVAIPAASTGGNSSSNSSSTTPGAGDKPVGATDYNPPFAREALIIVDEPAAPAGFPAADELAELCAQPSRRPVVTTPAASTGGSSSSTTPGAANVIVNVRANPGDNITINIHTTTGPRSSS